MSDHAVPVAMVGVTYREGPTSLRARLVAVDEGPESPVKALIAAGHIDGAVRIETCSRTEWLISSKTPDWAARLLEGALLSRVGAGAPRALRVRTGAAALHHLFHVAVGLDAVAEGEMAVGKQMLRSFARSNAEGVTDPIVRQCWKHLDLLLHDRREEVPTGSGLGVQSLVVDQLRTARVGEGQMSVLGRGEIGQAVHRALLKEGFAKVQWHSRATLPAFLEEAKSAAAVVICTGGPEAWLELPTRSNAALCVDIGSPAQIKSAEGWRKVGLDELLTASKHSLSEEERNALDELVATSASRLQAALTRPAPAKVLAAIDSERHEFLYKTLPPLLAGLPPAQAKSVERAVAAFTHSVIRHARATEHDEP